MNVAQPNVASSLAWLPVKRFFGGNLNKLTCLWEDGIFLGVKGSSGRVYRGRWKRSVEDKNYDEAAAGRKVE